ncbi:hypothetical protein ScPMuIL_010668 [Solemya velum]
MYDTRSSIQPKTTTKQSCKVQEITLVAQIRDVSRPRFGRAINSTTQARLIQSPRIDNQIFALYDETRTHS